MSSVVLWLESFAWVRLLCTGGHLPIEFGAFIDHAHVCMIHACATYHVAVCCPAFHALGVGSLYVHGVVADGPPLSPTGS